MTFPEIEHVRIGHGQHGAGLHAADDPGQTFARHLAAQQDFVADDDGAHGLGVARGDPQGGRDLDLVLLVLGADPDAQQHLHAQLGGGGQHPGLHPVGGIGPHASGQLRQGREVAFDQARR